jgi:hypothetical protein
MNLKGTVQFLKGQNGKRLANYRFPNCTDCCLTSDRMFIIGCYRSGYIKIKKLRRYTKISLNDNKNFQYKFEWHCTIFERPKMENA